MPIYSLAPHTKAHIDTNFYRFYLMINKIELIVWHNDILLYYVAVCIPLYISKIGEDRPGVGHIFGYQNIVPFSFGDACKVIAASAQNV